MLVEDSTPPAIHATVPVVMAERRGTLVEIALGRLAVGIVGVVFAAWLTIVWSEINAFKDDLLGMRARYDDLAAHDARQNETMGRIDERLKGIEAANARQTQLLYSIEMSLAKKDPDDGHKGRRP